MEEEEVTGFASLGLAKKKIGKFLLDNLYSIVIAICTVLVLVFVPMIGSKADVDDIIPRDTNEAILFWVLKGLTVALNLAIFAAFRQQARLNAKDNASYKKACEMLEKHKSKDYKPMSPVKFGAKAWGTKGVTLALSTAVTSVALTNIIIYYDWVTAVSCVVTITIAIVFGLFTMGSEQYYWEVDFLKYAESVKGEENGIHR